VGSAAWASADTAAAGDGRRVSEPVVNQQWRRWQAEVVTLLRSDFHGELAAIAVDDVDWPSWHPFFVQGRSPRAAIDRALERDV
jgi:hypothetical protein